MVTLRWILISISKSLIPHFLELIDLTSTRLSLVGPRRNHHCTYLNPKVQHEGFEHLNYDTRPKVRLRIQYFRSAALVWEIACHRIAICLEQMVLNVNSANSAKWGVWSLSTRNICKYCMQSNVVLLHWKMDAHLSCVKVLVFAAWALRPAAGYSGCTASDKGLDTFPSLLL